MDTHQNGREKLRVLVVDDDVDTADSSVLVLNYLGYKAVPAYNAEDALKIASMLPPQVVLLDAAMPGHDGYQLARELRMLPGMEDAMLICVSGFGTELDRERAFEAGCTHHFIKPVDWQKLVAVLGPARCPPTTPSHVARDL
jgi:two-component system, chemotaxis family, CheB/CheR fusion protein